MPELNADAIAKLRSDCIATLTEAAGDSDTEGAHSDADQALCDLLAGLGFSDVVELYHTVDKWYA